MKNISVFIESSGKKNKVKSLFEEIGFNNVKVYPTKGRLFDLPSDKYAIDDSDFSVFSRTPLSERKVTEMSSALSESDVVFLVTDNDIEGEIIAHDLTVIAKDNLSISLNTPELEFYRLKLKSLTKRGLEEALSESNSVNDSVVAGGLARRIFDRYLGYNFSKSAYTDNERAYIGRIVTPVISSIESEECVKAWISTPIDCEGERFDLKLKVYPDEIDLAKDFFNFIPDIEKPEIVVFNEEELEDDAKVWNGTDALIALSSALEMTVDEASTVLQELYEEGKISYPRTDAFYLSKETVESMKKMANEFGVAGFDDEFFQQKAEEMNKINTRRQDAHEGISPLESLIDIYAPLSSLGNKEQALSLIIRNTLRAGQKERKIIKKHASFTSSKSNSELNSILSRFRSEPIIERIESKSSNGPISIILNETKPFGSMLNTAKNKQSLMRVLNNDEMVLRRIRELGLGRPSTDALHSTKIASRLMTPSGKLNKIGEFSCRQAREFTPKLISPEVSKKIEDTLHYGSGSIDDKINKAILLAGIDKFFTKDKLSNEHSLDASELDETLHHGF
ncbi:DNA topoisomerase [Psychromonas sp. SP041]|uniref:DNA topoisomerase n=1 Tax=Psychromonas sp. SP041 TaxID=1365007 RepID=UPI0010C7D0F4|nr:DNA topoisomerase [Psychromonas sp. SP041]